MDNEAATRSRQIDVQLRAAGWMTGSQRAIEEFVVTSSSPQETSEFADYALIDDAKEPIAIVEASRVMTHVFDMPASIGSRAEQTLRAYIGRGEKNSIEELESLLANIGTGWPMAKLQKILDELKDAALHS